ncbi:unnamed protein product [Parascedosporium putredinis]|uniref:PEX14-like helix-turn-helix domain-containing protein n=1 Tax=Parascedosporium putredinis TaxID=1442378 RepID=A0A9P1GZ31_9PEZI|nr:unnamed protein product [Parascedosporium putredinis]CAI7990512.1 unnamed protein product [Parascedosporium putredinis]
MDAPTPPTSASQAPEPQQPDDRTFIAFDTYPWTKDEKFLANPPRQHLHLPHTPDQNRIRFVRSAYFTRIIGIPVSADQYATWLAAHPDHPSPDPFILASLRQPQPDAASAAAAPSNQPAAEDLPDSSRPAWQSAAPKAELFIDRSKQTADQVDLSSSDGPAYPSRFAELIRCIKEGLPCLVSVKSPKQSFAIPKPWEKAGNAQSEFASPPAHPEESASPFATPAIDQEFPPLEKEQPSPAGDTTETGAKDQENPELPDVRKLDITSDNST